MNILKNISAAVLTVSVAMLSSCSDKGYWDQAPLEAGLSFQCAQYNETLAPGANEIVIPIDRTLTAGAETVELTFTPGNNCPSDINVPASVTFEGGSNTANIVIKIDNALPTYTYSGKLEFSGEKSYGGVSAITLKCSVNFPDKIDWTSIGQGAFLDTWVMGDVDPYSVEIHKADGFERYRVVNPYKEYYASAEGQEEWNGWIASNGPEYFEFWELGGTGALTFISYSTGLLYYGTPGQPINEYNWDNTVSPGQEGYDVWYAPGFAVFSPVVYIPGVGGWGQQGYSIQVELPQ